jgi:hypothetical protein
MPEEIKLTREIIEGLGWEPRSFGAGVNKERFSIKIIQTRQGHVFRFTLDGVFVMDVEYLSELQNLYRYLAGEELTVNV